MKVGKHFSLFVCFQTDGVVLYTVDYDLKVLHCAGKLKNKDYGKKEVESWVAGRVHSSSLFWRSMITERNKQKGRLLLTLYLNKERNSFI